MSSQYSPVNSGPWWSSPSPSQSRNRPLQLLSFAFLLAGVWYLFVKPADVLDLHYTDGLTSSDNDAVDALTAQFAQGDFSAVRERHKVGICLTVNNEAQYMDEFLLYHLLTGVDHFYVYDDESQDGLASVLEPYITGGVVTLKTLRNQTGNPQKFQWNYMRHCYEHHRDETQWLGHWDVDEFLQFVPQIDLPRFPYRTANGSDWRFPLNDILELPQMAASLGMSISRLDFPNVGFEKLPSTALMTQTHLWRRSYNDVYTKSIVHTINDAHLPLTIAGAHGINVVDQPAGPLVTDARLVYTDTAGKQYPPDDKYGAFHGQRPLVSSRLLLNHYLQRDLQDCVYKANRRKEKRPTGWRAQKGPEACTASETFLPLQEGDDSLKWQRGQLVYDDNAQRSYASFATQAILQRWNTKGKPLLAADAPPAIETISTSISYYS